MRKFLVPIVVVILALAGVGYYKGLFTQGEAADRAQAQRDMRGATRGAGFRSPVTVEMVNLSRGAIESHLEVVGSLIGESTVEVVPKTGGRLISIGVRLGDRVRHNQAIAKIEDREIVEQVKQAQASYEVAQATIRQREADLKFAEINLERARNLYGRQLLPKQSLDDTEARYSAAVAQLDLSRAQFSQAGARLEELRITLANTTVYSPVDGFVGKRHVDPGAWASNNAPIVSVVDISSLRLVANVVEKDLRVVTAGAPAAVQVDAYPGETFNGHVARVAPVLDPTTRTAEIEIEVPNTDARLKPGMYARMRLTVESRPHALLAPKVAIVDVEDQRGVFVSGPDDRAKFVPVVLGIEEGDRVEIRDGVQENQPVVASGAAALRDGDILVVAGREPRGRAASGSGGAPGDRGMGGGGRPRQAGRAQ